MTQATWSKQVKERDGHKCFLCGSDEGLIAHHVLPSKTWPESRFDLLNGISLCKKHHAFGRESVHRGSGALRLFLKLQNDRPEQFKHIYEYIHECK